MKLSQLQEALPISVAKTYVKAWDPQIHKQVFDAQPRKDRNAYRVYVPFETHTHAQVNIPPELISYLSAAIPNKPYETMPELYMAGQAREVANPTRILGIGKMLNRSIQSEKDPEHKMALQAIKQKFDHDPQRAGVTKTDLLIAFSRHPYDVAGMSTDRGWSSCMDLVDGANRRYVLTDVKKGSIIAYLIRSDDLNIRNPMARVLIKPYQEKGKPQNRVMMGDMVYGSAPPTFKDQVDAWINKNYNVGKTGLYCLTPGLYRDDIPQQIRLYSDEQIVKMKQSDLISQMARLSTEWPRIKKLRTDADDIFWGISEQSAQVVKLIQDIDLNKFVKAFKQNTEVLLYVDPQTDQIVATALQINPESIMYVHVRTPDQDAQVTELMAEYPEEIKQVRNPTPTQLQQAFVHCGALGPMLAWFRSEHVHLFTAKNVNIMMSNTGWDELEFDYVVNLLVDVNDQLLQDATFFEKLCENNADWCWEHYAEHKWQPTSDQLRSLIMFTETEITHLGVKFVDQVKQDLAQIPPDQRDAKFRMALIKNYPELMGAWSDWSIKQLKWGLEKNPDLIHKLNDPEPELVQYAIEHGEDVQLDPFNTPKYQPMLRKLLSEEPAWILDLKNPSQDLVNLVLPKLKQKMDVLYRLVAGFHTQISDTAKAQIVTWHPELIKWVDAPSYEVQKAAVYENPDVFDLIPVKLRDPRIKQFMRYYRAEFKKEMAQINKELAT